MATVASKVGSFARPCLLFGGLGLIKAGVVFLAVSLLAAVTAWKLPETLGQEMGRVVYNKAELDVLETRKKMPTSSRDGWEVLIHLGIAAMIIELIEACNGIEKLAEKDRLQP